MGSTIAPTAGKRVKYTSPSPMTDSPGQILCTMADDSRLIAAGAAAVSQQAARRAGLSWEAQEEIAAAAIEVVGKAFAYESATGTANHSPIRLGVSDLPDRIELTLEAAETREAAVSALVAAPLERTLAEQVRCEVGKRYFRMTISKPCGAQARKPAAGDSPAHH
jgi:hypothetical protein